MSSRSFSEASYEAASLLGYKQAGVDKMKATFGETDEKIQIGGDDDDPTCRCLKMAISPVLMCVS